MSWKKNNPWLRQYLDDVAQRRRKVSHTNSGSTGRNRAYIAIRNSSPPYPRPGNAWAIKKGGHREGQKRTFQIQ